MARILLKSNETETRSASQQQRSFLQSLNTGVSSIAQGIEDFGVGAAKGVGSTAFGLAELTQKLSNISGLSRITGGELSVIGQKPKLLEPEGTIQRAGFMTEQIAEFLVPFTKVTKIAKVPEAFSKARKLLGVAGKIVGQSAEFAGKTAIQTGGDVEAIKRAVQFGAIGGAIPPALGITASMFFKGTRFLRPLRSTAQEFGEDILATTTGVPQKAFAIARERAAATRAGFKAEVTATTLQNEAKLTAKEVDIATKARFKEGLDILQKGFKEFKPTFRGLKIFNGIMKRDFEKDVIKPFEILARKFRISISRGGVIKSFPASIESNAKKKIIEVNNILRNHTDFSPKGMQNLADDLQSLAKFAKEIPVAGQKVSGKTPVVDSMLSKMSTFIRKTNPELGDLRAEFGKRAIMLQAINDIIKVSKEGPVAIRSGVAKLTNIFKEDNDIYIETLLKLEQVSGKNFLGRLAGTEFQKKTPGLLRTSLALGGLATGAVLVNPLLLLLLPVFSPRAVGELLTRFPQLTSLITQLGIKVSRTGQLGLKAVTRATQEEKTELESTIQE